MRMLENLILKIIKDRLSIQVNKESNYWNDNCESIVVSLWLGPIKIAEDSVTM